MRKIANFICSWAFFWRKNGGGRCFILFWNGTIKSKERKKKKKIVFWTFTSHRTDFIQTNSRNEKNKTIQFLFLVLLPLLELAEGFGAGVPPPRNFDSISLMSGNSPPSLGNWMFSISFLVSGSLIIFGSKTRRIKGRIIMRIIGENRKSVTFHCSRCWKYLNVVRAFNFNG